MQLTQSASMRMEQRQLLTPRMIQSMEILQLPLMALEERIEQEIQNNPVLEIREGEGETEGVTSDNTSENAADATEASAQFSEEERPLLVKENSDQSDDFDRLARISDYLENEEFSTNGSSSFRQAASFDGERDKKLDAMNNTAARGENLSEHLLDQWSFIETTPEIKRAGEVLINYIDAEGYLRTELEQIRTEVKNPPTLEDLQSALKLLQKLEPAGVAARNLRECLLLQLDALAEDPEASEGHDLDLERALVSDHLKDLEMNRYPQISKRLGRDIEELKAAVKRLGRLHPHPGKQIGVDEAPPITPDASIYFDEEKGTYEIEMKNDPAPNLYIRGMYRKMLKERKCDKSTREFLTNNIRNARWLIE
ncbi:MAG TPA: hypothetical protein VL282_17265, partial [Tepidisphaeraceae bacterium]|nr:hypothetical protein [Tepidisphaeraceae bacterium]